MRTAGGGVGRPCLVLVRGIDPDPGLAACYPQQAAVVHGVEQVSRRARRAAPIVGDGAVREVFGHLAGMHRAVCADKVQKGPHVAAASRRPRSGASARVHQDLHGARDVAIVHEEVFVHVETSVSTFEIAGAVAADAVTQREILRARRCPDGIGLHEAQRVERALQRGRGEEAARDRSVPHVVEGHPARLSGRRRRRIRGNNPTAFSPRLSIPAVRERNCRDWASGSSADCWHRGRRLP